VSFDRNALLHAESDVDRPPREGRHLATGHHVVVRSLPLGTVKPGAVEFHTPKYLAMALSL
jgi:hypothetical protein